VQTCPSCGEIVLSNSNCKTCVKDTKRYADVYRTENNKLQEDANKYLKWAIILIIPLALYMIAFVTTQFHFMGFGHLMPMIVFGWPASYFFRKYRTLQAGLKGERSAVEFLSRLPKGYHVFSNVKISFEKYQNELDLIIVGENGVFIVEVKNHNGQIVGDVTNDQWTQHKVGRKGTPYSKEIRNPIKQVRGQVMTLYKNFKSMNLNVWIQGVILFTNSDVGLQLNGKSDVPVLITEDLNDYITSYESKVRLNNHQIDEIKNWLLTCQ
jgi:ribosomal protein L32